MWTIYTLRVREFGSHLCQVVSCLEEAADRHGNENHGVEDEMDLSPGHEQLEHVLEQAHGRRTKREPAELDLCKEQHVLGHEVNALDSGSQKPLLVCFGTLFEAHPKMRLHTNPHDHGDPEVQMLRGDEPGPDHPDEAECCRPGPVKDPDLNPLNYMLTEMRPCKDHERQEAAAQERLLFHRPVPQVPRRKLARRNSSCCHQLLLCNFYHPPNDQLT